MNDSSGHIPVLHSTIEGDSEVLRWLSPKPGETVIDVTLGLGGHALAFKKAIGPNGLLIGIDADPANLKHAEKILAELPGESRCIHTNFKMFATLNLPPADIIFADIGVSSPHFDDPERGFSFRFDGPLDLRFDRTRGKTASEYLFHAKPDDIAEVLRSYGELKHAGKIAHALSLKARERGSLRTTHVKECAEEVFGYKAAGVLPQIFQALRIRVNDELGALETLLLEAPKLLKPGGRLGIISFHSLEDRSVKQTFRALAEPEKDLATGRIVRKAPFELLTKKAIMPSPQEIAENPRSRSARLRVLRKIT